MQSMGAIPKQLETRRSLAESVKYHMRWLAVESVRTPWTIEGRCRLCGLTPSDYALDWHAWRHLAEAHVEEESIFALAAAFDIACAGERWTAGHVEYTQLAAAYFGEAR